MRRLILDGRVRVDKNRQKDIHQHEVREDDETPEVDFEHGLHPNSACGVPHLRVEQRRVEVQQHRKEGAGREGEGVHVLELMPEELHPDECVPHEHHDEQHYEVHQIASGRGNGPGYEPQPRLEVEALEDSHHEDDHRDGGGHRVLSKPVGRELELRLELQELELRFCVCHERPDVGGGVEEDAVVVFDFEVVDLLLDLVPNHPRRKLAEEERPVDPVERREQVFHESEVFDRVDDVEEFEDDVDEERCHAPKLHEYCEHVFPLVPLGIDVHRLRVVIVIYLAAMIPLEGDLDPGEDAVEGVVCHEADSHLLGAPREELAVLEKPQHLPRLNGTHALVEEDQEFARLIRLNKLGILGFLPHSIVLVREKPQGRAVLDLGIVEEFAGRAFAVEVGRDFEEPGVLSEWLVVRLLPPALLTRRVPVFLEARVNRFRARLDDAPFHGEEHGPDQPVVRRQRPHLGPELVEHLRGPILLLPKFPELEGKARLADVLQLGRVHARRGLSGTGALVLGALLIVGLVVWLRAQMARAARVERCYGPSRAEVASLAVVVILARLVPHRPGAGGRDAPSCERNRPRAPLSRPRRRQRRRSSQLG
mmetsp:Transcript_56060/g.133024  ORF Transcript_56060/g.133024 Transcript_56060/m.133024 type:complete len:594 (-) Transcript_56060:584-2365(-)